MKLDFIIDDKKYIINLIHINQNTVITKINNREINIDYDILDEKEILEILYYHDVSKFYYYSNKFNIVKGLEIYKNMISLLINFILIKNKITLIEFIDFIKEINDIYIKNKISIEINNYVDNMFLNNNSREILTNINIQLIKLNFTQASSKISNYLFHSN